MWVATRTRLVFWWSIFLRPAARWLIVTPLGLIGGGQLIRDEFLSPAQRENWRLLNILPDWSWEIWAIIILSLLLVFALEGSFRLFQSLIVQKKLATASLDKWSAKIKKRYRVYEAAFLWFNIEPPSKLVWQQYAAASKELYDVYEELQEAIEGGQIKLIERTDRSRYVSPDELRKFALSRDERPGFLFENNEKAPDVARKTS